MLTVAAGMLSMSSIYASDAPPISIQANVGYVDISNYVDGNNQINPIRLAAIRETATQLAATGALAWRSEQIDRSLAKQGTHLDTIFNFNRMILHKNVLPPVVAEADNSLNLASSNSIRADAQTYKIISPARFVTTPPTWRDYLWMSYPKPSLPPHSLLPKNKAEAIAWNTYFKQGWTDGLQQANSIFDANLNRLKRDYSGMIIYRKLLDENIVSAPYVAQTHLGVTGDKNEIRINDRVIRITNPSKLNTNSKKWIPVFTS
jgi:defect in organelle trafficking protein DotC